MDSLPVLTGEIPQLYSRLCAGHYGGPFEASNFVFLCFGLTIHFYCLSAKFLPYRKLPYLSWNVVPFVAPPPCQ